MHVKDMSLTERKPVFGASEQAPHKPGCAIMEDGPEASLKFVFRKQRDCTICVAKTKARTSLAVTAKLTCVPVFAYAKSRPSRDAAHIMVSYE